MDDCQQFLGALQKRGSKRHHITHCLGARDAWKWVRKNKWKATGGTPVTSSLYSSIVDTVNTCLVELLLEGHEVEFPHQMGSLRLSSAPTRLYYKNGSLCNNYRTDWKKTLELWYEDREAMSKHIRIKRVQKRLYFIEYLKKKARYKNRRFYMFRANRSLVRELGKALESRRVDTMSY